MRHVLAVFLAVSLSGVAWGKETYFPDLTSGRYDVGIDGMLCHTCSKIVLEEVSGLDEVAKAAIDFDHEMLQVTVRPGKTLRLSKLRRALKHAAKRVDLDTKFDVKSVLYRV